MLKFDDKFEVHDDVEVLKRMGLLLGMFFFIFINDWKLKMEFLLMRLFFIQGMDRGESSHEDIEKLKKMVPKSYQKYIESELI